MATPGIIYDLGGKFDQSWNQGLFESAKTWEESSGETFRDLELQSEAQRLQALFRFADAGYSPVFLQNTFNMDIPSTFEAISSYPSVDFVFFSELVGTSGSLATASNAYIIVFDSLELSRVAGYAAALTSQTGTVGFIGGVEDTLSDWAAAFAEGARSARPGHKCSD